MPTTIGEDFVCTKCNARQKVFPIAMSEKALRAFQLNAEDFAERHARCVETEKSISVTQWQSPEQWVMGADTGMSSLTIWSCITGKTPPHGHRYHRPMDGDDFGRCLRLVRAFGWRNRLSEVSDRRPEWRPIVDAWDELAALHDAKDWHTIFVRLGELSEVPR